MYIIVCRAHFCHLLGLGQVCHSPRGTSGSAGTLDWGPMWLGSQSTCHPQCIPHTLHPLTPIHPWLPWCPPNGPNTPMSPQCPFCHLYPFWPLSTYTPCQPQYTPDTPWCSLMAPTSPKSPQMPPIPLLAPKYLHSLKAPIHPWHPPKGPNTP